MSQSTDEKFGSPPQTKKWGERPNAPTVRTVESIDEYKIIAKAFDAENIDLIMPVISADQYAAFDALVPNLMSFYMSRDQKVNPEYQPDPTKEKYNVSVPFAVSMSTEEIKQFNLPPGTKEAFQFFEEFRTKYKVALTAENGYFGELISRWLESIKSAEQKGTGGTEPRRGWSRFFLGSH